jgi:hypothetical protein
MARPTDYTPELGDQICELLADGMSLRAICQADDMPHRATVFRWLARAGLEEFRDQYARARVMGSYRSVYVTWDDEEWWHDWAEPSERRKGPRCGAKTRAGCRCLMRVEPGKARCRFHGGLSTGPKTEAGRGRIADAQRQRWRAYREQRAKSTQNSGAARGEERPRPLLKKTPSRAPSS